MRSKFLYMSFSDFNEILNGHQSTPREKLEIIEMLRKIGGNDLLFYCKTDLPKDLQKHHKIED